MFRTKEIKTNILGEKLKKAREGMKMALWQAARKTKIQVKYLKYLEQGDYKNLPSDVYVIAYLKKYAEVLKLDIEEISEQFKAERGIATNLSEPQKNKKTFSNIINKPYLTIVTPKRVSLVLAIIVIALIFGYFWHQFSYLINPPSIKIVYPDSDLTIQEKSIEILGQTEPDTQLTINGKEVYVDNSGYFQGVISLESGLNVLQIEAKDRSGKINTVIRRIMVTK